MSGSRVPSFTGVLVVMLLFAPACGDVQIGANPSIDLADVAFDTVAAIGAFEGESWEMFGRIAAIAIAPDGRFAVLDDQTPAISLFDASGQFIDAVTARGQGPGELRRPIDIEWQGAEQLLVLDPANTRISQFQVDEAGFSYGGQRTIELWGEGGLCVLGDRIFIDAYRDERVIQELNTTGEVVRSFSEPRAIAGLDGIEDVLREYAIGDLSVARLLCDPERGRILEVGITHPRIQMHLEDGTLAWAAELAQVYPLKPVFITSPTGNPGYRFESDETTGAHLNMSVVPWDAGRVLAQYARQWRGMTAPEGMVFDSLESRLVHLETGEEESRTGRLPSFLAAAGDRFFHVRTDPFPQVLILERITGAR